MSGLSAEDREAKGAARDVVVPILRDHTCWHDPALVDELTEAVAARVAAVEQERDRWERSSETWEKEAFEFHARMNAAEQRLAAVEALHTGLHRCTDGWYWVEVETPGCAGAIIGLCPSRAALKA